MTARSDAAAHLAKAEECLEAATTALTMGLDKAATSNAVTSGINAKDAICLTLVGRTGKSDHHGDAVDELRRAGGDMTTQAASTLGRLFRLKNRSQYLAGDVSAGDATKAVGWARTLVAAATEIVAG